MFIYVLSNVAILGKAHTEMGEIACWKTRISTLKLVVMHYQATDTTHRHMHQAHMLWLHSTLIHTWWWGCQYTQVIF